MKISLLVPDLRGGGAERVTLDLAYEFSKVGHQVELVVMQANGEFLQEARDNFVLIDLSTQRFRMLPHTLGKYIRQSQPDVIIAAMWPLTVIAPFVVRLSRCHCKVLVSEHNTLSIQYDNKGSWHHVLMRASMFLGYTLADHRVSVSKGVASDIASLSGLPISAFDVINNPVSLASNPPKIQLSKAEKLWGVSAGARILTVGSMKTQKNHALLLRAFASVTDPKARLMFVGDGLGRDALVDAAHELGLADRVIFAGFCSDPTPFYRTADLFVLSSDYEGFGNVIVEAMACGLPVVSTDCPFGPSEILDGGRYGTLVPTRDPTALARAIESALTGSFDRDVLFERAREFSPNIAAQKYLKIINEGS